MQSSNDKANPPPQHSTSSPDSILLAALKAAQEAIEDATDILFSGQDGTPVTFLKPEEIEEVYLTLIGVMVQVDEAIRTGGAA